MVLWKTVSIELRKPIDQASEGLARDKSPEGTRYALAGSRDEPAKKKPRRGKLRGLGADPIGEAEGQILQMLTAMAQSIVMFVPLVAPESHVICPTICTVGRRIIGKTPGFA